MYIKITINNLKSDEMKSHESKYEDYNDFEAYNESQLERWKEIGEWINEQENKREKRVKNTTSGERVK